MRKIFCLALLIGSCAGLGKGWYWIRNGFSIARMQGWTQELVGSWWDQEADTAIAQKFYYLGRGRQAFAFVSEDGKYVLKFPRADIYKIPFWLRALPFEKKRERQISRKAIREAEILYSFQLAIDELQESTAIVALNCSKNRTSTSEEGRRVTVVDKIGRSFELSLDHTYFILQKKKQLFRDAIVEAASKEGTAGVERVMDALFAVIVERTAKGILNRDGSFLRNYGFDEERAYQTDVGSFFKVPEQPMKSVYFHSMELSVKPIRRWMKQTHPEWLAMLDERRALVEQL